MPIPEFTLPSSLSKLVGILPPTPPSWLLAQSLNLLYKRGVLPADMALLEGRTFDVHVRDAGLHLFFCVENGVFRTERAQREADLTLSANLADFMRMMLREEDPDTLFFNRRLGIEGDTELGLVVKNLLDSVDWSQTPLSRFMAV
ncbi:ubiquinone anaerobic biosynthesis accessory factor UbiT [Paludibacterium paludis]|uniref:Ubiquinone biosynthesis accessory factor UbiT n=1 Tax=Paludibacterium paludis TaxID=1225769 RepID=A0A918UB94_9NEIS|nr:SCP2 sterol-binding domain-containing protein [Paludibacterium paludis]GGY27740.1 hypothetical protein GCM10011289_33860 [Paludibacterium paludis]